MTRRACGWKKLSSIAAAHLRSIPSCLKDMWPAPFCCGGHQKTSSIWKRSLSSSAPLALQNNLPHAYNRLGTILAHIGLLDHARAMYERGSQFHPRKAVSPSIVQVYIWNQEYDAAREAIQAWREENPGNKYAIYFAPYPAMMTGQWEEARELLDEALQLLPEDPIVISLQGVFYALTGKHELALDCMIRACASPKSFGHAHHTYYQIACILALAGKHGNCL